MNTKNFKDLSTVTSLIKLSRRTVTKMLNRANKGCSICGWNESNCDIHHIIDVALGGSDDMSNLILVCPNHHRMIHTYKNGLDVTYLKTLSLDKTFSDWADYYNPKKIDIDYVKCKRVGCENKIGRGRVKYCCLDCYGKDKAIIKLSVDEILNLLKSNSFNLTKTGNLLGVSANSLAKFCKKHSIVIEKIKFKNKDTRKIVNISVKISQEDREYIKNKYVSRHREFGSRGLARKFGIDHTTILDIVKKE